MEDLFGRQGGRGGCHILKRRMISHEGFVWEAGGGGKEEEAGVNLPLIDDAMKREGGGGMSAMK